MAVVIDTDLSLTPRSIGPITSPILDPKSDRGPSVRCFETHPEAGVLSAEAPPGAPSSFRARRSSRRGFCRARSTRDGRRNPDESVFFHSSRSSDSRPESAFRRNKGVRKRTLFLHPSLALFRVRHMCVEILSRSLAALQHAGYSAAQDELHPVVAQRGEHPLQTIHHFKWHSSRGAQGQAMKR